MNTVNQQAANGKSKQFALDSPGRHVPDGQIRLGVKNEPHQSVVGKPSAAADSSFEGGKPTCEPEPTSSGTAERTLDCRNETCEKGVEAAHAFDVEEISKRLNVDLR